MEVDPTGELSEILGILGHNHPILRDGAREDDVVGIAQSAAIPGWIASCSP